MKKLLSVLLTLAILLTLLVIAPTSAVAETSGDYQYSVNDDGTAMITSYNGSASELKIPSVLDGHTVTSIGGGAYYGCDSLKSVTVPDSVTSIGSGAFFDCMELMNITIPDSVTSIGEEALGYYLNEDWNYCTVKGFTITGYTGSAAQIYANNFGFTFISLGEAPTTIPTEAPTVSPTNSPYGNKDGYNYYINENGTAEITKYEGTETEVNIPSELDGYSVTSIGWMAFSNATTLTSVTIPDTVTSIDYGAFYDCTSLSTIIFPDSIIRVARKAFYNTAWYDNRPNGPIYVGKVFYKYQGECPASVDIKEGTETIADSAFLLCDSLKSVTLPSSLKTIDDGAFDSCSSLASINIPTSIIKIGNFSFYGCTSLLSVTIPASVTSIGNSAFGIAWRNGGDAVIRGFTIRGYSNTAAQIYANQYGIAFVNLGEAPTEPPTEPPTDAPTDPPAVILCGDADGDGHISILDATAIQRNLAAYEDTGFNETAADADGDTHITVLDATAIQRHLADLPTYESIGKPIS